MKARWFDLALLPVAWAGVCYLADLAVIGARLHLGFGVMVVLLFVGVLAAMVRATVRMLWVG